MDLSLATTTLAQSGATNIISAMEGNTVVLVGFGIIGFLVFFAILGKMITTKEREQTKRELAAYIAEGSMTPEQGEQFLNSKPRSCGSK